MSNAIANLIANKFIARTDVKAVQFSDGTWSPHTKSGRRDGERLPWTRADLLAHLDCRATYGHYLLESDSTCKLFAFDVDLNQSGQVPLRLADPAASEEEIAAWEDGDWTTCEDLRGEWLNRQSNLRPYMKCQFKEIAHKLLRGVYETLGIPCAAAYSGGKGIHVYGFTGLLPASDAREGAEIVLESMGGFSPSRGTNFFTHEKFPNLSIEVFPKQTSLDGKDLGNLMRLPLGRNMKSKDPTFFLDMTVPMAQFSPVDPEWALTAPNPWVRPGE